MDGTLKSSIDLTPFVGLLLALLVAMLAISPNVEAAAQLDVAPPTPPAGAYPPPPPRWTVSMMPDESIWISQDEQDPQRIPSGQILSVLPPGERVYLRAEAETEYGAFAELAARLEASGRPIAIVNEDPT